MDIKALQAHGLLVVDDLGGIAVVNGRGWTPIPQPLASVVRAALGPEENS